MDIKIERIDNNYQIQNNDLLYISDNDFFKNKGIVIKGAKGFVSYRQDRFIRLYGDFKDSVEREIKIRITNEYKQIENIPINYNIVQPYIKITIFNIDNKEQFNISTNDNIISEWGYIPKNNMWFISDIFHSVNIEFNKIIPNSLMVDNNYEVI